ncbi:hypothetical protein AURDEDRAFT_50794 [Auricularia subglabra TFB-10046 SS5]|nr:hypothetical protein AURDEDRAFT_50794 [Auricularia subglabra TFB-10046 SS5]
MPERDSPERGTLPTEAFEQILPAVVDVLELSQQEIGQNQQKKLALVQATNKLKERLTTAKEIAQSLPGGELTIDQQDVLIVLLERIRDHKRQVSRALSAGAERAYCRNQLASFAATTVSTNKTADEAMK